MARPALALAGVLGCAFVSLALGADQDHFWHNSVTGESTWERPAVLGHDDPSGSGQKYFVDPKTGKSSWDKPVESAWMATTVPVGAENAGREFYFNEVTKEATWEKPAALAWSKKSGRAFWHNDITGQSTWDRPADLGTVDEATGRTFWTDPSTGESVWEPTNERQAWKEVTIPEGEKNGGHIYYNNEMTKEVSWDKPEPLAWTTVHPDL